MCGGQDILSKAAWQQEFWAAEAHVIGREKGGPAVAPQNQAEAGLTGIFQEDFTKMSTGYREGPSAGRGNLKILWTILKDLLT